MISIAELAAKGAGLFLKKKLSAVQAVYDAAPAGEKAAFQASVSQDWYTAQHVGVAAAARLDSFAVRAEISNGLISGYEYLHEYYAAVLANPRAVVTIYHSGDSTAFGAGVNDGLCKPWQAMQSALYQRGMNAVVVNRGVSGITSAVWLASKIDLDIAYAAANGGAPALYIIRLGMNDITNGISVAQSCANLTSGIAKLRTTAGWSATKYIILTPNTAGDNIGRTEVTVFPYVSAYARLARQLGTGFVNIFQMFQESTDYVLRGTSSYTGSYWLDESGVHPGNEHELLIQSRVSELVCPDIIRSKFAGKYDITPAAGFSYPGGVPVKSEIGGNIVYMSGFFTPPATITAGQVICTVNANHRPGIDVWRMDLYGLRSTGNLFDELSWPVVPVAVFSSNGQMKSLVEISGLTRLYVSGRSYAL